MLVCVCAGVNFQETGMDGGCGKSACREYAPELHLHQIKNIHTTRNEENLHNEIIHRHPSVHQVQIACDEDGSVERLCLK